MNANTPNTSSRQFCTGVPESTRRWLARTAQTAWCRSEVWLRMKWPSSSTHALKRTEKSAERFDHAVRSVG